MDDERYFRLRGWIPMPLYASILLGFDAAAPQPWELTCGMALAAAGVALRGWARMHIGRSSDTRRLHARRRVSSGPYAFTRNPLYLGNVAIATGLAILIGARGWAAVLALAIALHYHRVVRAEERMLERTFGEPYREYCARVRRWLPVPRTLSMADGEAISWASLRREGRIAGLALLAATLAIVLRG